MIDLIFKFANDHIFVRINGNSLHFGNTMYGPKLATIEGIKLDRSGVLKEFPDLSNNPNWKEEAIKRFKDKISSLDSEKNKSYYVINELSKHGYIPLYLQESGKRRVKIQWPG